MSQEYKKNLDPLEFQLLLTIKKIDLLFTDQNILFNLLVSGGMDSMCLLEALNNVLNSRITKTQNKYHLIVQHFNHKKRAQESDEDAYFVSENCLKKGVPVFLNEVPPCSNENFQNFARNFRKKEAANTAKKIKEQLNCSLFFILTAHHARDHVETVLMHILRGSGLEGLEGIKLIDNNASYFRPFIETNYQNLINYSIRKNISYRKDSSNDSDKYTRNYLRHHVLNHLKNIQPDYENKFRQLSNIIKDKIDNNCALIYLYKEMMMISAHTQLINIYQFLLKNSFPKEILTQNVIKNIFHECEILLNGNMKIALIKVIALKRGFKINLIIKDQQLWLESLKLV